MTVLFNDKEQLSRNRCDAATQKQRSLIGQELQQNIQAALQVAKALPIDECLMEIEKRLLAIQAYCKTIKKTFIVVEEKITCEQYELGGSSQESAVLFRGLSQEMTVAICITAQGSLLHYNGYDWIGYRNVGDVYPGDHSTKMFYSLCRFYCRFHLHSPHPTPYTPHPYAPDCGLPNQ